MLLSRMQRAIREPNLVINKRGCDFFGRCFELDTNRCGILSESGPNPCM